MITNSFFDAYDIVNTSDDAITLEVKIGNNQPSSSILYVEGQNSRSFNNEFRENLGASKDLHGKALTLVTTIFDLNQNNDNIQMSFHLSGGKADLNETIFNTNVDKPKDLAVAMIQILFV
jgi:hypothetical protein